MSQTPPMSTVPLPNPPPANGNGHDEPHDPNPNREKRSREDGSQDDRDRSDRRRRHEHDSDQYDRERERRHRHRDRDYHEDDRRDRERRRHREDETDEEREERRRRRKEREREREREYDSNNNDRRSSRHVSEARSNAVELLPEHLPNEEGRLNEEEARERDRAREREREERKERRERDRSRESYRSHRSRDTREREREREDRVRPSREEREAERERRDREMRDERREAARMRDERFAEMDRDRERERRMYARREERGGPYSPPRPRRSSPSYDNAPPPRDSRPRESRERSPPPSDNPADQVFRTIERETRSIFVSQIAARITSADLGLFFEDKLGPESVRDARIVTDRLSRRSKGIGYVELADAKYVPKALQLSGTIVMGIPIIIQMTESERNREGKTIDQLVAEATKEMEAARPRRERDDRDGPRRGPVFPPLSTGLRLAPGFDPEANADAPLPYHRLFLQNVAFSLTESDIRAVFEPFGQMEFVDQHVDHHGQPKGTAYVQFVNLRDAQMALDAMNGFELAGRTIKAMPISERSGIEDDMDERKGGRYGGPRLDAHGRMALMQKLARTEDAGSASPSQLPSRPAPPPQARTDPTPFIVVSNMFNPEEETDRNWDTDLAEDVKGEIESKYGKVKRIKVDKMSAAGEVYVEFADGTRFADAAVRGLNGRFFGGKSLKAEFISEALFGAHL